MSVNVQRSFSTYKHILNDKRQSFKESNLEKVLFLFLCQEAKKKMQKLSRMS